MKILFSPEYSGHVFIGLNEQHPELMDTMVCDNMGLVAMLELRLGIHVDDISGNNRTVLYYKAMSEYMKRNLDNALAASFRLSSLGTAEQALRWRDNLVLDKWQANKDDDASGRLNVLAGTEEFFNSPGMSDRLKDVLLYINRVEDGFFKDFDVELPCELAMLHPAIQELLTALQSHGARISSKDFQGFRGNNLSHIAHMLNSSSDIKLTLNKDDRSFQIYKFADEKTANEYLALKGDELQADVWINNANKTMDNWLRMMGKPTMGSSMAEAAPQLIQLFVLGIDMLKEPLNIQSLISWLYSPMQPFGTFFGGILAETVIGEGGYRNDKCRKVVEDYISGKFTYHDKEEEEKLSEEAKAKRDKNEKKERQLLVNTYLPSFDVPSDNKIDCTRLMTYLNSISGWARSRAHFLSEKSGNEGWCSQLESLAQMCDTFVLLLESSDMGEYVDFKQVESWISTLYKGESFMQYAAQRGSRELIDSPSKMAADSGRTVWMNFVGGDVPTLDCAFLYPTERAKVKDSLMLWDERKELDFHHQMQLLPFFMTEEQLILVVTDYVGGESAPKHPIMVRLESQVENLNDFITEPNLYQEETEKVKLVRNNNIQSLIPFDHADLLKWPQHLSPTTISTLVEYPFDYLMERMLNIVSTGPSSIKDVKTTMGTVAHAVIESLFAPRDGKSCSRVDEIEQRINNEFEEQVRKQIESCGAILYLPENRLDAELLKEQLRRCLGILLEIIRDNRLTVTGCEQMVKKDC